MSGQPAQTPVVFLLAGGSAFFDAACVAALLKCGLHPDDFGSYDHVKNRIRAAKRKIQDHKEAKKRGEADSVPAPDAHDKLLDKSEAGHLMQNAIFQGSRGNNCTNQPGSEGYHSELAPSGPQMGTATKEGSTHCAATQHDATLRDGGVKPGTALNAEQLSNHSMKSSEITARGAGKDALADKGPGPKRVRTNELKLRKASAAALDAETAGTVGTPADNTLTDEDAQKAAECIDAFTAAAFEAMRNKVMQDYGPDYATTKERLQQEETAALKAKQQAKDKLADIQKKKAEAKTNQENEEDPAKKKEYERQAREYSNQEREAFTERAQASQDYDLARNANESAHCLHEQVTALQQQKAQGPLPTMVGTVPPGPGQKRPKTDVTSTPPSTGAEEE